MKKYYVIHTKPKQEKKALINLKDKVLKHGYHTLKKQFFLEIKNLKKMNYFFLDIFLLS